MFGFRRCYKYVFQNTDINDVKIKCYSLALSEAVPAFQRPLTTSTVQKWCHEFAQIFLCWCANSLLNSGSLVRGEFDFFRGTFFSLILKELVSNLIRFELESSNKIFLITIKIVGANKILTLLQKIQMYVLLPFHWNFFALPF